MALLQKFFKAGRSDMRLGLQNLGRGGQDARIDAAMGLWLRKQRPCEVSELLFQIQNQTPGIALPRLGLLSKKPQLKSISHCSTPRLELSLCKDLRNMCSSINAAAVIN